MTGAKRPLVLCVDDEIRVVESLALTLRKEYEVHTAMGGEEGLQKLKELREVAVVVSDMRMPGMNGAAFLKRVMREFPHVGRILLTGDPGRDAAIHAVNEGQILRFLTKPCPPHQLKAAIEAAVLQYRLARAESSVLQETLIGSIQALTEVLAIANPVAFGRASRVKRIVSALADKIDCSGFWQLEAATMLSQLGYIALPGELVEKLYEGKHLTAVEQARADAVPEVANKLLAHIPRLEPVLQILSAMHFGDEALRDLGEGTIRLGARMLSLVLDYDTLLTQGHSSDVAMQTLRGRASRYGESLVDEFRELIGAARSSIETLEMRFRGVQPGMILMDDLRTSSGTLLVPRGFQITETFLERMHNSGSGMLDQVVRVQVGVVH